MEKLNELTVASLLRTLTAPRLLNLIALERENQFVKVLRHITRKRHGQVEMQGQPGIV